MTFSGLKEVTLTMAYPEWLAQLNKVRHQGIQIYGGDGTDVRIIRVSKQGILVPGTAKTISVTKAVAAAENYAAEDIISENVSTGTVWTWAAIFRENGVGGYLTQAIVSCETTALTHRLALYLFNAATTSEVDDNKVNDAVLNADISQYVGRIDFPALEDLGGNSEAVANSNTISNMPLWVDAASDADDLIGILVTRDAITGETVDDDYTIKLTLEQY